MQVALKIDVDTLKAAQSGVPLLVELLQAHGATATFFFNMGLDRSGRASGPLFEFGEIRAHRRLAKRLMRPRGAARWYGTLLGAPAIALKAGDTLRQAQTAGHEIALRGWDPVNWVKQIAQAPEAWIKTEYEAAQGAYLRTFGQAATVMAAPGWRSTRAAFRLQQRSRVAYASDTRGSHPFMPIVDGEPVKVPQLPTTLPTILEARVGCMSDEDAVAAIIHDAAAKPNAQHVFTINAQTDTGKLLPALKSLFAAWHESGVALVSLNTLYRQLQLADLPWHDVEFRHWPGYEGNLACQGRHFPR
ncbi:MAG: polysaccharide deacetylase family protein [Burkholderiales bacterium]|nr:polysaccharide deacetylase family protein [Burkholderiales bacterium]